MPISDCGSDVCSADLSGVSSHETEQSARRGNAKMRRAMRRYVMKISECMSRDVQLATPDPSLQSAAQMMADRSEEHTSELQSLMRISYAVFRLKKKNMTNKVVTPAH